MTCKVDSEYTSIRLQNDCSQSHMKVPAPSQSAIPQIGIGFDWQNANIHSNTTIIEEEQITWECNYCVVSSRVNIVVHKTVLGIIV